MIALAAKFNNHDLQASSAAPGKTWFHSFTKGLTESVIEGNFLESTIKKSKMVYVFKFSRMEESKQWKVRHTLEDYSVVAGTCRRDLSLSVYTLEN